MKVEFRDSQEYGPNLYIEEKEFVKARNNADEFDSMVHAIDAFYGLFGISFTFSNEDYKFVEHKLQSRGAVAFVIKGDERRRQAWCEVWVLQDNNIYKIIQ